MLLHHAADPNVAGKGGLMPLMCATLAEEKEIIELLLDAKANPDVRDETRGWTALHHAAFHRKTTAVQPYTLPIYVQCSHLNETVFVDRLRG